jgi:hypothetical protein
LTLQQKIADVLARLSTLSEASASTLEPRTSHGKSSSKAPPGVPEKRAITATDPDLPPPKERSLYDWYRWQFERADLADVEQVNKLLFLAERDFNARSRQGPTVPTLAERRVAVRSGTHLDQDDDAATTNGPAWPASAPLQPRGYDDDSSHPVPGLEDEKAAAQQVVDLYEGVRAEEAAVFENVPIQVIHKARKQHKRNVVDGRPRPPFLDWDDNERRRQIRLLQDQAKFRGEVLGAKALAIHFGVAKGTVRSYLEPVSVAA